MSHRVLTVTDGRDRASEPHGRSQDGCAQLLQDCRLGAIIRNSGARQRLVLHHDADAVHARLVELSTLDSYGALLIFRHAKSATVPDYGADVPLPQPVMTKDCDGRERVIQTVCRAGDGHIERRKILDAATGKYRMTWVEVGYPYCPLTYWPSLSSVAQARLDYRLWFNALSRLLPTIPPLDRWTIAGLGAEAAPWGWDNDNQPLDQR